MKRKSNKRAWLLQGIGFVKVLNSRLPFFCQIKETWELTFLSIFANSPTKHSNEYIWSTWELMYSEKKKPKKIIKQKSTRKKEKEKMNPEPINREFRANIKKGKREIIHPIFCPSQFWRWSVQKSSLFFLLTRFVRRRKNIIIMRKRIK